MALLLLDLDNTLVDRDAAFGRAVAGFLAEHSLPAADLAWAIALDASGYTPRRDVAAAFAERYGESAPAEAVAALLDMGVADGVTSAHSTRDALLAARAAGWTCAIVTNGRTAQQEAKIRTAGLDRLVDGWVVSEAVGHRKPEPEIFLTAAETVGAPLSGAWVVGDSPQADIAGAHALGLPSVWVPNGRTWDRESYAPTHVAADVAAAIGHILDHAHVGRPANPC